MAKPVGAVCNLDCQYCFYLEKPSFLPGRSRMREEVLEVFIRERIASQESGDVVFAWQGGEPTLAGLPFFRKVVEMQARHSGGKRIANTIQTNGMVLDHAWCDFFLEHEFLVGLSVDGPAPLHDAYRVDRSGRPSFAQVNRSLRLLVKRGVDFNTLTVVHRKNFRHALEVYRFLRDSGSSFLQFIPLVERRPSEGDRLEGLSLARPPSGALDPLSAVTEWSLPPEGYGDFLCAIFDEWIRQDVGRTFVQMFDIALAKWHGEPGGLCLFQPTCGAALALEHNGDLFSCDHYVYPEHKLGNILQTSLPSLVTSPQQIRFGSAKRDLLPDDCRNCRFLFACHGECPKNRFVPTPTGPLNYLCPSYKKFFQHVEQPMRAMSALLQSGRPPSDIRFVFGSRP